MNNFYIIFMKKIEFIIVGFSKGTVCTSIFKVENPAIEPIVLDN